MTAIIGIYCRDGVVIGADSSASFSHTPAFRTIEQQVRKLEVIGSQIILARTWCDRTRSEIQQHYRAILGRQKGCRQVAS